ncbi:hypothetical protein ON010_g43 [Phytophthora cinnamomi]|nr:hypothetical protein ON010_g43 [Phytophthora cinnamomi]
MCTLLSPPAGAGAHGMDGGAASAALRGKVCRSSLFRSQPRLAVGSRSSCELGSCPVLAAPRRLQWVGKGEAVHTIRSSPHWCGFLPVGSTRLCLPSVLPSSLPSPLPRALLILQKGLRRPTRLATDLWRARPGKTEEEEQEGHVQRPAVQSAVRRCDLPTEPGDSGDHGQDQETHVLVAVAAPLGHGVVRGAASAASKIKSNLSTVTKLPTALKRSATTNSANANANDDNKANVGRAPTIPSRSDSSSTESAAKQEAPKQHGSKMFSIPSMMRIRTGSKEDKTHESAHVDGPKDSAEDKSELSNNDTSSSSETEGDGDMEATSPEAAAQAHKSAINSASRFVMGMPTLLRRAVSNNTPATAAAAAVATQKKSPDTSANSTPRGQLPEDDFEENERHSLLMMMQVPESRRNSQIPLMAVNEAW